MRWWERQIGGPMRGRIIALLRRGSSTVEELAAALGGQIRLKSSPEEGSRFELILPSRSE